MISRLFERIDNSPLIIFRIIFGFLITAECWGAIATGWVKKAFITPQYTFPFIGFEFLQPLEGNGMYYYYIIMGLCGIFIAIGFFYRLNMALFALLWTATYLMQKTNYNNHYYLLMLLNYMMLIVPAHHYASLDAKRNPEIKSHTCQRWCILIFAVQMSLVYFYAGIAKLNPDWLAAKPMLYWLQVKSDYVIIGSLLGLPVTAWLVSYGGILFDLFIAQGLWFRKTRTAAFICAVFFHLFNSAVFQVGIFPYLGIAATIFFFPPDKIRRIFFKNKPMAVISAPAVSKNKYLIAFFIIWFTIQLALPLRHWLFPGNVSWTEEGHRLSWHMMLRQKIAYVSFRVRDNDSGKEWKVKPQEYLTLKQSAAIGGRPDMLWQFVQILKKEWKKKGYEDISIYSWGTASLNQRESQPLFDPEYDLVKAEWHPFRHSEWLVPLRKDDQE